MRRGGEREEDVISASSDVQTDIITASIASFKNGDAPSPSRVFNFEPNLLQVVILNLESHFISLNTNSYKVKRNKSLMRGTGF